MVECSVDKGVEFTLSALLNARLAALLGAGLSMASPSLLPSAEDIASTAKFRYDSRYGSSRDPLPDRIEDQAEFFFRRGDLTREFLRTLVDRDAFAGPPNTGHSAVADLLLVNGIQTAVTTNIDDLVEAAGESLFGHVGSDSSVSGLAALPPTTAPLLKIHGCGRRDWENTLWAKGQLLVPPFATRIKDCAHWLRERLRDRDLLVVGFWTDWDYLNKVLEIALGEVIPSRVIVVDPAESSTFAEKAPVLTAIGARASSTFFHVPASGAEFLDKLRVTFSRSFVSQVLYHGKAAFEGFAGAPPDPRWLEPPTLGSHEYWLMRRDLEGRKPSEPAKEVAPPSESLVGLTLLRLRARGAVPDGSYWELNGRRIRVLRASNTTLNEVEAAYGRETPPATAPDIVVAIGALRVFLPPNIVRGATLPTIVRGQASRWMTFDEALTELAA